MKEIQPNVWMFEKEGSMCVPAIAIASEQLLSLMQKDNTLTQLKNVATLPNIVKHSIVMPDGHQGYGFPIGGVAAFPYDDGIISPGGIGFDINCGVRLIKTSLKRDEVTPKLPRLLDSLFKNVPSGLGSKARVKFSKSEIKELLSEGAPYVIKKGYGWEEDLNFMESNGSLPGDPSYVSDRAISRGAPQAGSLGAGNHFLEVQHVEKVYSDVAKSFGLEEGQVVVMIHTGSRGLGHQVCSDYLRDMERQNPDIVKSLPDRELIYAKLHTDLADHYMKAMYAAANFAFANRQMITHWVRQSFESVFGSSAESLGMSILYDVAHNIAKTEYHDVDGVKKRLIVHRKGATRSFPAGHDDIPNVYRSVGQPVLIPGSMGTASYVLVGSSKAMSLTFGSTAHGSGRVLSRHAVIKSRSKGTSVNSAGIRLKNELENKGILVRSASMRTLLEESPEAYKDIDEVVRVSHEVGIGNLVARLRPMGVVKG